MYEGKPSEICSDGALGEPHVDTVGKAVLVASAFLSEITIPTAWTLRVATE